MVQPQPKVNCGSTRSYSTINFACNGTFRRFHKTAERQIDAIANSHRSKTSCFIQYKSLLILSK